MGGPGSGMPPRISDEQIARMRLLRSRGWSGSEIAREFGCAPDTVWRLTTGKGRRVTPVHRTRPRTVP